ncbi:hypothetical protein [Clostridium novyi]|uniref:Uncharacterized protein n=1 Tax=Clostridium novyi (strain NT) TaxID=386415 RepID=A0Q0V4_CLONN|nr:hypothetical protein [Clostridium novyi]ABK61353.1 hypothetical protein NT01CX_2183 [Clostridium novyi NT]KEH88628.1 hypothetical protein Z966_00425 [Clostridium novyi A str. NCTC 538]
MLYKDHKNIKVDVNDNEITFKDIYNKDYFPIEYESQIKRANVLLIPIEKFKDYNSPVFPEGTQEFFEYIKEKSVGTKLVPDICISDNNYKELELHSSVINLCEIIVKQAVLSIITSMIGSYFYEKLKQTKDTIRGTVKITVECDGESKKIQFEGNIEDFERTVDSISNKFFDK